MNHATLASLVNKVSLHSPSAVSDGPRSDRHAMRVLTGELYGAYLRARVDAADSKRIWVDGIVKEEVRARRGDVSLYGVALVMCDPNQHSIPMPVNVSFAVGEVVRYSIATAGDIDLAGLLAGLGDSNGLPADYPRDGYDRLEWRQACDGVL